MNILERTTTEEYDEDGRLTSRTTVEKYAPEAQEEVEAAPTAKEKGKQFFDDLYKHLKSCENAMSEDGEDKEYRKGFMAGFRTCTEKVKIQYEIWNCYDIWSRELPETNA